MIYIDKENKMFHLQGKNISYVFAADSHGFLRHLYFGEKLTASDNLLYAAQSAYLGASVNFDGATSPLDNLNAELLELSCAQLGDYRRPSLQAELPSGSTLTDFCYSSYRIVEGHHLPNLPQARGGETLEILLDCAAENLRLSLFYTVFDDCDAVVRSCKLENLGKKPVIIHKLNSFTLDFGNAGFDTLQLVGNWASERMPERSSAHAGILEVTSAGRGTSSHCHNPFVALLDASATENSGDVFGVNLVYSGSFSLTVENSSVKLCRLQGGIDSENFRWKLDAKQSFYTPQAVLAYSNGGIGGMSRAFHDFYREHLINPVFAHAMRPVLVNNWEATYFDFNREKLMAIVDCAAELGIDTFVLDDGWFTNRNDDTNGLGDWVVNTAKLSGGLKPIADHCHAKGLKFGLWFEPEMVNEGTKLFAEHPEWVLHNPNAGRVRGRNQLVLDFSNPQVVEHIFEKMKNVISSNGVDYIKWDMNRYLADLFSAALPASQQGEVCHRYVLGVYSLAEKLTQEFPNMFMEGCSGGGGRFDAGMLYYFPQIWTSDNTDAYSRTYIQHGTSICYPPSAMSAHFSVCPNHQTRRVTSFEARYNVACTCSFGYELDICRLSDEEKAAVKSQVQSYRADERLVVDGDFYRLADPQKDNLWAVCQVDKQKSKARVVGMRGLIMENCSGKMLKIEGLRDDKIYRVKETGLTASGKTLRCLGAPLSQQFEDFETFCFHLAEIEQ